MSRSWQNTPACRPNLVAFASLTPPRPSRSWSWRPREQNVRKAISVADHVIVLVLGNVRYSGDVGQLEREVDLGHLFIEGKG
jgi:hypothetical protein